MNQLKNTVKNLLCFLLIISVLSACTISFAADGSNSINILVNGNTAGNTFKNGILTATGSGSDLFALAVYEDNQLISLDFAYSEDELETRKLNVVIENGADKRVKIFRFDEDNKPLCENSDLVFDSSEEIRIYANEDFSDPADYSISDYVIVSDGRLELRAVPSDGVKVLEPTRPRHGVTAKNPGRYIVFEADYSIPEEQNVLHNVRLINSYYTNTSGKSNQINTLIRSTSSGKIYSPKGSSSEYFGTLTATPSNLAIIVDLAENTFDFYVNKELKKSGLTFLPNDTDPDTIYSDKSFFIGHVSGDRSKSDCNGTLYADNVKIYEGTDFKDIGNDILNVHHTDYSDKSANSASVIYERPKAEKIAKKVLDTSHPRLLINKDKVEEIKYSTDQNVAAWKELIIQNADEALDTEPYKYAISSTDSVENLPESMDLFMNLGLAYLLTGDMKYPTRAYEEAEVLYNVYSLIDEDAEDTEENRDCWNSNNCLDVTEISAILSICYDWMYDAWTTGQRAALVSNVMNKGITNMYKNYFGLYLPEYSNSSWWDITNNQGAVCNGSAIITAIAFMEEDAYRCSQIAESGIRALEIVLANFAPDGGWMESASYWSYTLKYFTMACCTLDLVCGTNYGLQNAPGLHKSCLYSLSIEGESGAMSFGDGSGSHTNAPFLFYWANAYEDSQIGGAAMYIKQERGFEPSAFDLVYYDADYIDELSLPEAFYYRGTEMVSFASGRSEGESYVVMSGGKGHATGHDHLDSGHVIVEMNGERVFHDIGAEYYGASGYFGGTDRHLYFRARPEAHNIFIINPYNTKDGDGSDYYGQSKTAVSAVTDYNSADKTATMDLSDAYARDAEAASRTISLDGKKLVIEDTITLKDTGDIYWNWYVTVKKDKRDTTFTAGNIEISDDGKYAVITRNDKKYKVSFETDSEYTLVMEAADYYVNVDPEPNGTKHSNETSRRLAVQFKGASGTVKLKTIIENME